MPGYLKRKVGFRSVRKILIVCEGRKTEPNYFKKFPINKDVIEIDCKGMGCNSDSLIEEAIKLKEEAERKSERYIQIWCVFDKDSKFYTKYK